MREFKSFAAFGAHLARLALLEHEVTGHIVRESAKIILADAEHRIGAYQDYTGPFNAWAPLADSTEAEKERLGYPLNAPLLREGDLRGSYNYEVNGNEAVIGSQSDIAVYQEMGTETIPPRPVIGPAAYNSKNDICELAGMTALAWLSGHAVAWISGSLKRLQSSKLP